MAITLDDLKLALPKQLKEGVNDDTLNLIKAKLDDPNAEDYMEQNILGFATVLAEGKFKIESYLDGVKYMSYRTMGYNQVESYTKTFPDRIKKMETEGLSPKAISSYVSAYNNNKLIQLMYAQTLVPAHIMHQDLYHKMLKKQVSLAMTAKSEMVQMQAADSVLKHLTPPKENKATLEINTGGTDTLNQIHASMQELAKQQRAMIASGQVTAKDITQTRLININRDTDYVELE